jgi:YjbE family integral membrane protein
MDFSSGAMWGALFAIIVANILLSGDNAVVIAMAARQLPVHQQKKAIFWGSAAAIVMRVILTIVAVQLLSIPFLKVIGGLLLFWIGVQLLLSDDGESDVKSYGTMMGAVRTILIADLVMSVDNVIAVAAAADKAPENMRVILLIVGLALSIPLIIVGSTLLMKVMERYPFIIVLGAALLGYLSGSMLVTDPVDKVWFAEHVPNAELLVGITGAVLVVVVAKWLELREKEKSERV